jgi:hypothetical protein
MRADTAPVPTRGGALAATAAPSDRRWHIPDRTVVLAGHRQLLMALRRTLQAGGPALLCTATDRAGAGATTTVVEFAHRQARDYDVAWWIPAADPELVPIELAALAEALGLAQATDDAETATARLLDALRHRNRYLLVFDDAENPRQLARFLPAGAGDVVIVSSDPDWRAYATAHHVEPFTRSESVALLCARRPGLPIDAACRIAAALDDLPLAVDCAAALLAGTGMDVEQLLRLLTDRTSRGWAPDPGAVMWEVAFDQLAADDPAALALLTLVAWLGCGPVPLRLITEHAHALPGGLADIAGDPAALARLTAGLRRHGATRIASDGIALHGVTAELLVARTVGGRLGDGADGWAGAAIRLLRAAVPADADAPATWADWRTLLPLVLAATDPARRLDAAAADAGWLLGRAARYLHARGQWRAAATLSRDAEVLCDAASGQPYEKWPTARVRPARVPSPSPLEA